MAEHLLMSIAIIVMVLGPVILETYVNDINPTPKMKDRNEESFLEQYAKLEKCIRLKKDNSTKQEEVALRPLLLYNSILG